MRFNLIFAWLLIISGCSNSNFAKVSELGGLRILALVIDQPYIANPSGSVTISMTPYVSDIGDTGDLNVTVQSCLDPGVSPSGPAPDCTNGANASSVQNITISALTGQPVGTFGDPERTGAPTAAISVPLNIPNNLLSSYSPQLQFNGVPYLITFKISNSLTSVIAYRQVFISNQANDANPTLGDIIAGGVSLTSLPTSNVGLVSSISSTPASYRLMSASGIVSTAIQNYSTDWYVSDGSLANSVTSPGGSTLWTVPSQEATGRKTVVVSVLRNGRGGENVIVRLL